MAPLCQALEYSNGWVLHYSKATGFCDWQPVGGRVRPGMSLPGRLTQLMFSTLGWTGKLWKTSVLWELMETQLWQMVGKLPRAWKTQKREGLDVREAWSLQEIWYCWPLRLAHNCSSQVQGWKLRKKEKTWDTQCQCLRKWEALVRHTHTPRDHASRPRKK